LDELAWRLPMAKGEGDLWSSEEAQRLRQSIADELASLFGHDAEQSSVLLDRWLTERPYLTVDTISHNGPFETAQRIHYCLVLGGDPDKVEYLDWRKQFHPAWQSRRDPQLTDMQKSILRDRGVDV
jgi:hypothetical protein